MLLQSNHKPEYLTPTMTSAQVVETGQSPLPSAVFLRTTLTRTIKQHYYN